MNAGVHSPALNFKHILYFPLWCCDLSLFSFSYKQSSLYLLNSLHRYSLFGVAHKHCYDLGWFGRATCNGEYFLVSILLFVGLFASSLMFDHCTFSNFYSVLFLYQICVQYSFVFVVVVCKSPPEVANSVRSWNGGDIPKYGEIIHYSCEEGYALIGNSIITCDEHGGYTPRPPVCESKS